MSTAFDRGPWLRSRNGSGWRSGPSPLPAVGGTLTQHRVPFLTKSRPTTQQIDPLGHDYGDGRRAALRAVEGRWNTPSTSGCLDGSGPRGASEYRSSSRLRRTDGRAESRWCNGGETRPVRVQRGRKFFTYRADLVEEAVQETLTRTCELWERANQRGRPEAWVVNTATHVCQEKLREERRGARCSHERSVHWDGDGDLVRSTLLADALRRLSTRQRLVVVWRYLFDLSVAETATALGLTESRVRDASHNGIERLRKILGDEWSEWS